jgi:predicted RNase H-like HicB family nuclease
MSLKKTVGSRKFTIRVQKAPEGGYTGQCIELPGAISEGETIEELKKNMTEAIQLVLDVLEEKTKGDRKIVIEVPA